MSPARLSIKEPSESELSLTGDMWTAQPTKKQKMQHEQADIDLVDDIETLWETRWKSACNRNRAPFQDASPLDVAPLFTSLIQQGVTSAWSQAYTQAFLSAAADLANSKDATATRLLNACALLRIARWPQSPPSSSSSSSSSLSSAPSGDSYPLKHSAYALQKHVHARAARMWDTDSPVEEVLIPHLHHAAEAEAGYGHGRGGGGRTAMQPQHIPALVRVPLDTLLTGRACPAVVVVSRSDRMGCTAVCEKVLARGWAVVVVETCGAGTEDGDEASVCQSVLAWMAAIGFYDMDSVVVFADGDDAGLRVASAVGDKLRGVVALLVREVAAVEEEVVFEAPPLCPSLVISERRSGAQANGTWTPVRDEDGEQQDDSHSDLYAFGTESMACISRLHTVGQEQVFAWVGDLMAGRQGGHFWTVIPAPEKFAGTLMSGRFEREWTPPYQAEYLVL